MEEAQVLDKRAEKGHSRSGSFLALKQFPNGYDMKDSLFITQGLRHPAMASLNVRMEEDLESLTAAAKETSIASQADALRHKFDEDEFAFRQGKPQSQASFLAMKKMGDASGFEKAEVAMS